MSQLAAQMVMNITATDKAKDHKGALQRHRFFFVPILLQKLFDEQSLNPATELLQRVLGSKVRLSVSKVLISHLEQEKLNTSRVKEEHGRESVRI